jgi:peptidyl-prolyl cis-trans isomerase C
MADKMQELVMEGTPEVVDDDIYDYYNNHIDEFEVDKQLRVREILVSSVELAESLRTAIDEGADFKELAGDFTERPGMKPRQGDLGLIEPYRYPVIYKAAENMRVNEIKGPIRVGDDQWSIIRLSGFEPPKTYPIEEVAEDIYEELTAKRQKETLENWLAQRRAEVDIEVNYDPIWETIDRDKYED